MIMKQILDNESDIPTASSHKMLWHCSLILISDREISTEEEASSEPDSSGNNTSVMWCKTD
jgi:hypothetical protein